MAWGIRYGGKNAGKMNAESYSDRLILPVFPQFRNSAAGAFARQVSFRQEGRPGAPICNAGFPVGRPVGRLENRR
jgi:hypothetical protein